MSAEKPLLSWLKPADWLKWLSDWKSIILLVFGCVSAPVAYFFGSETGQIAGSFAGLLTFLVALCVSFALREDSSLATIRAFLSKSKSKDAPEMVEVADKAARSLRITRIFLFLCLAIAICCLALLIGPPVLHKYTTKSPGSLQFPDARLYLPRNEEKLMEDAPFLLATITVLKDEGLAQGKNFR